MKRLLVAASVLLLTTRALAADVDDLILLKNGGRIRGVVIEEDPTSGVRLKLPDGTIRVVRAAEVGEVRYGEKLVAAPVALAQPPPVPPPGAPSARRGSIHVESASPGMVSVDGGEVGPAPVDVSGLTPGRHLVAIHFATGDLHEDAVFVQAGKTLPWSFAAPLPSDVKPFQLELAAFVGYGENLSSSDFNPYGASFGGRVGVLAYRFFFGLDITHTTGGTIVEGDTSASIDTNSVGLRAGYDIHLKDGFVSVGLRPFLGVESVWANESFGDDTASEQTWHFAPGVLGSVGIGPLAFVGVESRLSVGATPNALSFLAMAGARLF